MTEAEFYATTDPRQLLEYVRPRLTDATLRAWAEATYLKCQKQHVHFGHEHGEEWAEEALQMVLHFVPGHATPAEACCLLREVAGPYRPVVLASCNFCGGSGTVRKKDPSAHGDTDTVCCPECNADPHGTGHGTPHTKGRGKPACLEWNDHTLPRLAEHIRETGDWSGMAILYDAAMEAGVGNEDVLNHLLDKERCWECGGSGTVPLEPPFTGVPSMLPATIRIGGQEYRAEKIEMTQTCPACNGTGWRPLRGSHLPQCWAISLFAGERAVTP